ncbi:MAG: hypothetical protein A2070_03255 [Bdellovibrionales bacterium GWC1_52_8]|nr:MAG: hypothetical protein A2Z97_14925 [Bdellovibrionales bacterium GWB1_52_6]OFZ05975.1 MAG: hypothetical protein A2X97_01390 [Bdellovibrionales bacterium GWA1_52_35]OFZ38442.1 MAG: hypothetical protein A2070_03255 [Bdellovibrionales bacterium GWC1_52_8]
MDRKELKRPDQFTTSITRFFGELAKNRKAVAVVALAVILGSAVAMLFISRKQADGQKAHDELFLANDAVDKRLEALSKAATDAAADSSTTQTKKPGAKKVPPKPEKSIDSEQFAFKKLNVDQEFADAVQKYKAVIEKFGSTRAAFEARTALGALYLHHGEPEKAVPWLKAAAESAPGPAAKAYAWSSLGYALEDSAKTAEALQAFEKAMNLGESNLKGDLLLAIARCQEVLNDKAKARATYDQIISQLPNTEFAKNARFFKNRIQ